MNVQATVIIPTFNHEPTLRRSVPSALRQTVPEIEVIVIGDGVADSTRSIMAELTRSDERVRFIDRPKHESRAEPTRHAAVVGARGKIVCYLADDDLYLPNHVETMLGLLQEADFAHALPLRVEANGDLRTWTVDLERPLHRRLIAEVEHRIPLTAGAHTREAYLRLPVGWSTPPPGTPSDLFMWRRFLAQPDFRFASSALPTTLVFPSPLRRDWSLTERVAELDQWCRRIEAPGSLNAIVEDLLEQKVREAARVDGTCWEQNLWLAEQGRALEAGSNALAETARALDAERSALAETKRALDAERNALAETTRALDTERSAFVKTTQTRDTERGALAERRPEAAALQVMERLRRIYRRFRQRTAR